jgi:hypothetical protein
LDSDTVSQFDDNFNILNWWHEHKQTYPVLSILAKDALCVPCLLFFQSLPLILLVEMLSCIKDWEAGDARAQHSVEDKELEASFDYLYFDR